MKKVFRHNRIEKNELLVDETIFSIANGYIGTRGTFTEGYGTDYEYHQTYINAFYDFYDYHYEENLAGFPQKGQKNINVLDGSMIEFYVLGKALNIHNCTVESLNREYDLNSGITYRKIHYKYEGYDFHLVEEKIVSSKYPLLYALNVSLTSPNYEGDVQLKSYLKSSHKKHKVGLDPRVQDHDYQFNYIDIDPKESTISVETNESNLSLSCRMVHNKSFACYKKDNDLISVRMEKLSATKSISIEKFVIYKTSLYQDFIVENRDLKNISFDSLRQEGTERLSIFWSHSKFTFPQNKEVEDIINYNVFQLNNSGGEDYRHNIAAKGLSGEGYEGHYFWDTEIYMIPFFTFTNPKKAKNLLRYRFDKLEESKQEARNLGYSSGAKIPWRTINGNETSPYYPAGSAQFHINSDVAFSIVQYIYATNDIDFLIDYGYELLIETARFLLEAVNYDGQAYHLNSVTGPDEYTTVVDDNFYTNKMLQYHFKELSYLHNTYNERLSDVIKKLNVTETEMNKIDDVSNKIVLPFSERHQIFKQDARFLEKKKLDLSTIHKDKFPLLLNFHPLFLYKHQVLKQADTMLALMLLDYEDMSVLKKSFDYYEPITTHDSSLSKCIYSIVAYKLNRNEMAHNYFMEVLETDLKNTHKNTEHGLHVANLGGSYLNFLYGFLGCRLHRDFLKINPRVDDVIKSYSLPITYHGETILITVDEILTVNTTGPVTLQVFNEIYEVNGELVLDLDFSIQKNKK